MPVHDSARSIQALLSPFYSLAAHPLSRIVVVVFVVILSVVVVVCRLGPSSSTFPPSHQKRICLRRCFRWREPDGKTTADDDHDLEEDDEDNDNDS